MREFRSHLAMGVSARFMGSLLGVAIPFGVARLLDLGVLPRSSPQFFEWIFRLAAAGVLACAFTFVGGLLLEITRTAMLEKYRAMLAEQTLTGRLDFSRTEAMSREIDRYADSVSIRSGELAAAVAAALGALAVLLVFRVELAAAGATAALALGSFSAKSGRTTRSGGERRRFDLILRFGQEIRRQARVSEFLKALSESNRRWEPFQIRVQGESVTFGLRESFARVGIFTGFALIAGTLWFSGKISMGEGIASFLLLRPFPFGWKRLRFTPPIEASPVSPDRIPSLRLGKVELWGGAISFRKVGLSAESPLRFDFSIQRGARVVIGGPDVSEAMVGELVDLLSAKKAPRRGTLLVGEKELHELPRQWARKWSAWLGPDPVVFDGSLEENLGFGADVSRERWVTEILEDLGLSSFDLSEKLDFSRMDSSFRHRVAAARALLVKSELLVLQGFGRALDPVSGKSIARAISKHAGTVVAFGLDPWLFELAEEVVWVDRGKTHGLEPVDRFLASPRARLLWPRSHCSDGWFGQGAVAQARAWAKREKLSVLPIEIEFFGADLLSESDLLAVTDAVKVAVRGVDVVSAGSANRLRLLCVGASLVEQPVLRRRLASVLSRERRRLGKERLYFKFEERSEWGDAA